MRETPKEQCSLGSPAPVRLCDPAPPLMTTHRRIHSPGKTTFLKFMLARLISARQVVLLCDNGMVYLFYCGKVYSQQTESGFQGLPRRQRTRYCPIWALIDVGFGDQGPPVSLSSNMWPIQTTSPNPRRYKSWRKQNGAALLGMRIWEMEELIEGYVFSLFSHSAIGPGHVVR
jgi:hypothetical protein